MSALEFWHHHVGVSVPDLKHFNQVSVKLERFWGDQIRYQL